ncbi:sn-glycerol-1-phosphate dehydrogenase [Salibacterium aidingense]|uniref:sn-glycerol-1-phosphate dehydrogenase n=1 Tax=Salibacterium aidingense TaxID=384933 RepID=UPI0004280B0C|nr:sn-glycerol-1-phosphate dehydrogenase [Salibacterium aidingense]
MLSTSQQMKTFISKIGNHNIQLPDIVMEKGAISFLLDLLNEYNYKKPAVIYDDYTFMAAGDMVCDLLKNNKTKVFETFEYSLLTDQHHQVVPNEETIMDCMVALPDNTDVLIAVGTGTIHDIVRFIGSKMKIPFISFPTAASVDGFTSKGSPLLLQRFKKTIQTASPIAVIADLDVLEKAPPEMTASGFGDMLGKYTSLLDWYISSCFANEPYVPEAAEITNEALRQCVNNVDKISSHDVEGVEILMDALIASGLVMLVLDYSRPASGAEHHLSHFWEMELLDKNAKQLLHGAKVGVATILITKIYKEQFTSFIKSLKTKESKYQQTVINHWNEINSRINDLPTPEKLAEWLKMAGGPNSTKELGIDGELVKKSLQKAYLLRERCTGLRLLRE